MKKTYNFFILVIIILAFGSTHVLAQCTFSVTATNSGPVCNGDSVTLTGDTTGTTSPLTFSWTGPGSFSSAALDTSFIATVSGTYTLSVTDGICTTFDTTTLIVNPLPSVITGDSTVCRGSYTILSDTSTFLGSPGTWSISDTTIGIVSDSGAVSDTVIGISAGGATITYTLSDGCSATTTLTVNPLSAFIVGLPAVCAGDSISLIDSPGAGGTWSVSPGSVATIDSTSGELTGISGGTATVTFTLSSDGCMAKDTITINPIPVITGGRLVCLGQPDTLIASPSGGTWYTLDTTIATIDSASGAATGISTGTAHITYTSIGGCVTDTTIIVNPSPDAITGLSGLCAGDSVSLSDTSTSGTWSVSPTTVATVDSISGELTGISGGTATVMFTLSSGGCAATDMITVNPIPKISGSPNICIGIADTLSGNPSGGTWYVSDTTIATIDSVSGVVTGMSAGTDTISYISVTGCVTDTIITVNPSPKAITGPSSLCVGSSITLSDSTTAGKWSSYDTAVAKIDSVSGMLTGISGDTVAIAYSLSGGCATTDTIIVNAIPVITGSTSLCLGLSDTLSASPSGGMWHVSDTTIASIDSLSGVVTSVSVGTVNITYNSAAGCITETTIVVNPSPSAIIGLSPLCAGDSISLSDSATGGTWSASPTTIATIDPATGMLTGIAGGSADVTYSLPPGGCSIINAITVNPIPTISGFTSICQGLTNTLSASPSGGTWFTPDTTVATIDDSGLVTALSVGAANITYTSVTGCVTETIITVNPSPAAIIGLSELCVGSDISLSDSVTGGTWSAAPTSVATIDPTSGLLTGVSGGSVTVTYTLPPGGCSIISAITVNPIPAISGSTSLCLGTASTLSVTPTGGKWYTSDTTVATIDSISGTITTIAIGTVSISYISGAGCVADTTVTVNPSPTPISGPPVVCVGSNISLSDSPTTGGTWSTAPISVAIINPSSGVLTGRSGGTAIVTYSLPPGGCTVTDTITVNSLPASITGSDSICLGLTSNLSSTTTGGTWSISDPAVATVSSGGLVTSISVGTANVTYTLSTGCLVDTTITVNPLPGPVSGPSAVCAGLTINFTDDTTGGRWSSTSLATATIDPSTGVLTGIASGNDSVIYTLPTGCTSSNVVTVNPLPALITGPDSVCFGLTTTLDETTGSGTWSTSNPAVATINSSGTVTGISAGPDTITYTLITGCIQTLPFTVNPLPSTITGASVVCVDASVAMNDTSTGGTWSTSPVATATIDPLSGSLTGVSSGTVTVIYTLPTSCTVSTGVTVNPIPQPIGGTLSVCASGSGSTTSLTETTTPGTWSITPTSEATIDSMSGIVTGISAGAATVSYTLPVTGCYITAAFTVNPLPLPVTGSGTVCASSTLSLSDGSGPGTWSIAPTSVATISSTGSVTGISEGTAIVTYTLSTGCLITDTIQIDPQPSAVITPLGDTMICPGSFVALTATTGPGLTYQWLDPAAITGATTSTYVASVAGSYEVKVTNSLGCSLTSAAMSVSVDSISATIISPSGSTTACAGAGSVVLEDDLSAPGLSYQWQRDSVSIPGAVSFTYSVLDSSGSYRVIASNGAGCSATSNSIAVTIYPLPPDTIFNEPSTPLNFCAGSNVLFFTDTGMGYTYQWFGGAAGTTPIIGDDSAFYTATVSGIYKVQITNSYGCSATTGGLSTMEFFPPVATITSIDPTTFCGGGIDTLVASIDPGYSYQWYNDGIAISGATTDTLYDTLGGHFTLVLTGAYCKDTTTQTVITKLPPAEIVPLTSTSFCWGGGFTLSANVASAPGGITYQWFYEGVPISGATHATYSGIVPGFYSYTMSAGSCSAGSTDSVTITEFPLPNPLIYFDGTKLRTGNFYVTYQWSKDLVTIPGATDSMITPTADGAYAVTVTDTNGCQSESDEYILSGLSVSNVQGGAIKIYPNPAQGILHITSPFGVRAQISGMDGRVLLTQEQARDIDISSLASGVYLIMLYDDNGELVKTEKVVKTSN